MIGRQCWANFAHHFYVSLADDIRARAEAEFQDVTVCVNDHDSDWPYIMIRRRSWPGQPNCHPAVCLQWKSRYSPNATYKAGFVRLQYLRCGIKAPWGHPSRDHLPGSDLRVRRVVPLDGHGYPGYRWEREHWPMYKPMVPRSPCGVFSYETLEAHGQAVVEAMIQLWCDLSPLIDRLP